MQTLLTKTGGFVLEQVVHWQVGRDRSAVAVYFIVQGTPLYLRDQDALDFLSVVEQRATNRRKTEQEE